MGKVHKLLDSIPSGTTTASDEIVCHMRDDESGFFKLDLSDDTPTSLTIYVEGKLHPNLPWSRIELYNETTMIGSTSEASVIAICPYMRINLTNWTFAGETLTAYIME